MSYDVELPRAVPEAVVPEFLSKLHYVSEDLDTFGFTDGQRSRVAFTLRDHARHSAAQVGESIVHTAEKMTRAYRPATPQVYLDRLSRSVPYQCDPHIELLATDRVIDYGSGRMGLTGDALLLLEFFEHEVNRIGRDMGATPYQFPALIGADTLARCRYLRSFPHSLSFVTHLREDLGSIEEFAQQATWQDDHLECNPESLAKIRCLLAPSVCFHYYAWLANRTLANNTVATALGKCFRYESGNLNQLQRLWDFTMREVIFVGSAEHVLACRDVTVQKVGEWLDELGLAYKIETANDPFFIGEFATQSAFQRAFDLKFEVLASLPFASRLLAVGSMNYHQDFFGRSFDIRCADGSYAHSGCLGIGLERMVLAWMAQYGVVRDQWPPSMRDKLAAEG